MAPVSRLACRSMVAVLTTLIVLSGRASAETAEVRISQQFGLTWLAVHVMLDQKIIERRAQQLGLGDIKVTLRQFSGGPAANEALLSGTVDIAGAGGPPAMILRDKTEGRQNVRAIGSVVNAPISLVTTDARIKSLSDLGEGDRIALPAPKVSINAMVIQMAAAKTFGRQNSSKYDTIQVGLPHPDAAIALISGNQEIKNYMGIFPFVDEVLAKAPGARIVLSSYDVLGGEHNLAVLSCSEKWKTDNPKTFRAVALALEDAMTFINEDRQRAAQIYTRVEKSKLSAAEVYKVIAGKEVSFATTPRKTMAFAEFMHASGALKNKPKSWKDFFWENMYDKPGD